MPEVAAPAPINKKVSFLLRNRDNYFTGEDSYSYGYGELCSGLLTSARLVQEMVRDRLGFDATLEQLQDSNSIDRYVTLERPDVVILEAYWVPPSKLVELQRLHPQIKWVIRNHSAMPFLSLEGVVMEWTLAYSDIPNVTISSNEPRTDIEFDSLIELANSGIEGFELDRLSVLLPNYYEAAQRPQTHHFDGRTINIGCFGAIRPLKNHLSQAVAAILFARDQGLRLNFHINSTRIEQGGNPILKNMRAMFARMPERYQLVEHDWMDREDFLQLVDQMDIGMCVSFSETFSIVAADFITGGKTVTVSPEVFWVHPDYYSFPESIASMREGLRYAFRQMQNSMRPRRNLARLARYNNYSAALWLYFLRSITDIRDSDRLWMGHKRRNVYLSEALCDEIRNYGSTDISDKLDFNAFGRVIRDAQYKYLYG